MLLIPLMKQTSTIAFGDHKMIKRAVTIKLNAIYILKRDQHADQQNYNGVIICSVSQTCGLLFKVNDVNDSFKNCLGSSSTGRKFFGSLLMIFRVTVLVCELATRECYSLRPRH